MIKVHKDLLVSLSKLQGEGEDFHFETRHPGLTPLLADLIGERKYLVDLRLEPMGNVFTIRGKIATEMPLLCSRCGIDFEEKINVQVNELLVIEGEVSRTGRHRQANHRSDVDASAPFCNYLETDEFNLGEFIREQIAAAEPVAPMVSERCEIDCPNLVKARSEGWLQESPETKTPSPFAVLKNLKNLPK